MRLADLPGEELQSSPSAAPGMSGNDISMAALSLLGKLVRSDLTSLKAQAWLLTQLCQILNTEAGILFWLDQVEGRTVVKKTLGGETARVALVSQVVETGLVAEAILTGQPVRVDNVSAEARFDPAVDAWEGFTVHSLMCVPLVWAGETLGAIEVLNKRGSPFDTRDQEVLTALAAAIARVMVDIQGARQLQEANVRLEIRRRELLRSRNILRALFDSTPTSMYIVDRDYVLDAVNMNRAGLVGTHPKELVGRRCYEALFQRTRLCQACLVGGTFKSGEATRRTERRPQPDGGWQVLEISTYPVYNESGHVIQAILFEEDVTERRRLEASLVQSEKLAAVGQLAAGVAHEINNPLTAIIANAQLLQRGRSGQDIEVQDMLDLIVRASERASQVVRNLLVFARQERFELAPTDLNETLRRAMALIQHELSVRSIRLVSDLGENLPLLMASQDQLQGVWINLLVNAVDALDEEPGEIRVTSRKVEDEVRITISDNGRGIPLDHLSHIFEPFYTTKDPGQGTGLGLFVCHHIIEQHGGDILVESQPGKGTEFTVRIPLAL